jgi:predicted CopG family antitoxin
MCTRTIRLKDDVYERLKNRKREGESFSDLVDRLLDKGQTNWREGFGTLGAEEAEELEHAVETTANCGHPAEKFDDADW